jgi:hypothetical protein
MVCPSETRIKPVSILILSLLVDFPPAISDLWVRERVFDGRSSRFIAAVDMGLVFGID